MAVMNKVDPEASLTHSLASIASPSRKAESSSPRPPTRKSTSPDPKMNVFRFPTPKSSPSPKLRLRANTGGSGDPSPKLGRAVSIGGQRNRVTVWRSRGAATEEELVDGGEIRGGFQRRSVSHCISLRLS